MWCLCFDSAGSARCLTAPNLQPRAGETYEPGLAAQGGRKDVLVATDVASKGLDFPDIQHVINFDMPDEIENYVHRIGRTGRCGKTGIATTFINKDQSESILLDLKHLLTEAKQRIPPVLTVRPTPQIPNPKLPCGPCGCCRRAGLLSHIANLSCELPHPLLMCKVSIRSLCDRVLRIWTDVRQGLQVCMP